MAEQDPKPKLGMLCAVSQNYQHCFENNTSIQIQIIQEGKKWHSNFSWPSGSLVIDQTIITLHILINNLNPCDSLKC